MVPVKLPCATKQLPNSNRRYIYMRLIQTDQKGGVQIEM